MISRKLTKRAADYFRTFVRENIARWAELMRELSPKQGWGDGDDVSYAHDAAMFLYTATDEQFLDFEMPKDFASGADLLKGLRLFRAQVDFYLKGVEEHMTQASAASQTIPFPVSTIYREYEKCLAAVDEAIRLLVPPSSASPPASDMEILKRIARRFPDVVAQLAKRRSGKPALDMTDEYDVQYLFLALLRLEFDDIRPEDAVPSVAGGSGRVDCHLKDRKILIEFKMTRPGYKAANLRKELADDFVLYGQDHDGHRLFAFVYDPGRHIENPRGIERDLSCPRLPLVEVVTVIREG